MNIVDTCLPSERRPPPDLPAVLFEAEDGEVRRLTYAELDRRVAQAANALRSLGLGKGDAIGLFMPMIPEIVVALLAIAKIGGIILPLFSGFGAGAVAARLADAEARRCSPPTVCLAGAASCPLKPVADEAAARMPHAAAHDRRAGTGQSGADGRPAATTGGTTGGLAADGRRHREHRRRRHADDHLHLRHDRPAQRRRPHPLRLPGQGRPGHGLWHRRSPRRAHLLDDRHGLDDGPLAGLRRRCCSARTHVPVRRRARLPGPGPAVGDGRAPPADSRWASRRRWSAR